jgi:hypothetical protein
MRRLPPSSLRTFLVLDAVTLRPVALNECLPFAVRHLPPRAHRRHSVHKHSRKRLLTHNKHSTHLRPRHPASTSISSRSTIKHHAMSSSTEHLENTVSYLQSIYLGPHSSAERMLAGWLSLRSLRFSRLPTILFAS